MSAKSVLDITGVAAWVGGIATALAALSCDTAPCEADAQPLVVVRLWAPDGSARAPVQADSVRFQVHPAAGEHEADVADSPTLQDGDCLDDACSQWVLETEEPGLVQIWADACGGSYTAEIVVEPDDEACDGQPQYVDIEVDDSTCAVEPERMAQAAPTDPVTCDRSANPSVQVFPVLPQGDYYTPVDVDMVWYVHDGQTYEAQCLDTGNGCAAWLAGYELAGPITVFTEYCDTLVTQTVDVQPIEGTCHVRTEYMLLELSTLGCVASETQEPPEPPPDPGWPYDLVVLPEEPLEHPGGHGNPFARPTDFAAEIEGPPPPGADDIATPE